MKILKKLVVFSLLAIFSINVINASSQGILRSIGYLNGIVIHTYTSVYTDYLVKETDSNYIMNLSRMKGKEIVKHRLVNSNHDARSDWRWTKEGERESLPNRGYAGYKYGLELVRSGVTPYDITLFGSWSPDAY